jgi:hypothetical protein
MNEDQALTFAIIVTTSGAVVAAGLVTTVIEIGKKVFPGLYAKVNGLQQAFILTVALYIAATLAIPWDSPDDLLGIFMSWVACLGTAIAGYEVIVKEALNGGRSTKPKPSKKVIGPNDKFDD